MMQGLIVIAGLLMVLAGLTYPVHAQGQCEREKSLWTEKFEALARAAEDYRCIKNESVAPKINELMASGTRINMAATIRSALNDRSDRLAEAGSRCQDALARERTAYETWRRCGGSDRRQKNAPHQNPSSADSRERDRFMADLQDLLLDEAYVQYKGQAPVPTGGAGREPDQREAYQDYRPRGYGGQAPAGSWWGYQGYYR